MRLLPHGPQCPAPTPFEHAAAAYRPFGDADIGNRRLDTKGCASQPVASPWVSGAGRLGLSGFRLKGLRDGRRAGRVRQRVGLLRDGPPIREGGRECELSS